MAGNEEYFKRAAKDVGFVRKRKGFKVPFDPQVIVNDILKSSAVTGEMTKDDAVGITNQILGILHAKFYDTNLEIYPGPDVILDVILHCLYENNFASTADNFKIYRAGKQHVREGIIAEEALNIGGNPLVFAESIRWQKDNGVYHLEDIDSLINGGELSRIIHESSMRYRTEVQGVAEKIATTLETKRGVVGFGVTGPSSSGKTTTTDMIIEVLKEKGWNVKTIPIDNYFKSLDYHKKDLYGDFDFEEPHAIDLNYFFSDLEKILNGEEVLLPFYDFKDGESYNKDTPHPEREKIKLEKGDALALDFLHLLYIMAKSRKLKDNFYLVYIEPMFKFELSDGSTTRYTEINMMRRCARDSMHRGWSFDQTIEHWGHVRDGQLTYMVPLLNVADAHINSGLIYDHFILKAFMDTRGGFSEMPHLKYDKRKQLNYALFRNIKKAFDEIEAPNFEEFLEHVRPTDIVAEFVPVPGEGFRKQ